MAKAFPLITVAVDSDIASNAPIILHIRLAEMLHFSQDIHYIDHVTELHAMRIAAKRLRYTLEIFQPFMGQPGLDSLCAKCLAATKKIQEMIGDIHDRDVRIPQISEFLKKRGNKNTTTRPGLTRLLSDECRDRDQLYTQLTAHWDSTKEDYTASMMRLIHSIADKKPLTKPVVLETAKKSTNAARRAK